MLTLQREQFGIQKEIKVSRVEALKFEQLNAQVINVETDENGKISVSLLEHQGVRYYTELPDSMNVTVLKGVRSVIGSPSKAIKMWDNKKQSVFYIVFTEYDEVMGEQVAQDYHNKAVIALVKGGNY